MSPIPPPPSNIWGSCDDRDNHDDRDDHDYGDDDNDNGDAEEDEELRMIIIDCIGWSLWNVKPWKIVVESFFAVFGWLQNPNSNKKTIFSKKRKLEAHLQPLWWAQAFLSVGQPEVTFHFILCPTVGQPEGETFHFKFCLTGHLWDTVLFQTLTKWSTN